MSNIVDHRFQAFLAAGIFTQEGANALMLGTQVVEDQLSLLALMQLSAKGLVHYETAKAKFSQQGVRIRTRAGDICTISLPIDKLEWLSQQPEVHFLQHSAPLPQT